jgi:phosphate transport system regulatory protein PhoU
MIRIKFQQSLDELKERLLVMAGLVEQAIQRATESYTSRDESLCELVRMSEPAINRMEREIDQLALDLLAMEQPMAVDLRFILSVIRINVDLERMGDQAVNIAGRVLDLGRQANVDLPVDIPRLALLAAAMVRKALQAFIEGDAEMAQSVLMPFARWVTSSKKSRNLLPRRSMRSLSRATWNGLATTLPTSQKMSSSGCVVQMSAITASLTTATNPLVSTPYSSPERFSGLLRVDLPRRLVSP